MAKGDGSNPLDNILQMIQQNPQLLQQLGTMQGQAGQQPQPTGNVSNFMAGQRKTMGNPNPVNPYGFTPPSQRGMPQMGPGGPNEMGNPMGGRNSVIGRAPQMNMSPVNSGFIGGVPGQGNTGITGGMNKTYAPSGGYNPNAMKDPNLPQNGGGVVGPGYASGGITSDGMGMKSYAPPSVPSSLGMTQNNPYAPKNMMGQVGSRPY